MKRFKVIKIVLLLAMLSILMACEKTNEKSETVNNIDKPGSDLTAVVIPANEKSETVNNGDKPKRDVTATVISTYVISGTVSGELRRVSRLLCQAMIPL